jgi:hemerythrin-like domain-containing protein
MTAIELLKHEHQIILLVLEGAARQVQAQPSGSLDAKAVGRMVDFFQVFVERCHNAKEEEYLFPKLEGRGGMTAKGQIAVLLQEHADGRDLVQAIAADLPRAGQGDSAALDAVAAHLSFYAEALRAHIDKEDNVLFSLADRVLTTEDREVLLRSFDKHEAEEVGVGVHEKYHRLAQELSQGG